jgi:RimJ/RimL family protein N-acetyltransferase
MTVFTTDRLLIRTAEPADTDVYYDLWTDPRVMANVGFPEGLRITRQEIRERLSKPQDGEVLDRLLVAEVEATGEVIGECMLHRPGDDGIASTDVKLLPRFQGMGYGTEIKRGLLDYLFTETDCIAVEASPNRDNTASVRMQEAVGGQFVREETYRFPDEMKEFTRPVHCLIYRVTRETWSRGKSAPAR